jgi:hypothetical protein
MITVGAASVGYGLWEWRRRVQLAETAKSWIEVAGKILSVEVAVRKDSDADEYEAKLRYAYRIDGQHLIGTRIRAGGKNMSTDEALIRSMAARYRPGQRVSVRVDPARHDRAVLEAAPEDTGIKPWLIFGGFLLASSAYAAVSMMSH